MTWNFVLTLGGFGWLWESLRLKLYYVMWPSVYELGKLLRFFDVALCYVWRLHTYGKLTTHKLNKR